MNVFETVRAPLESAAHPVVASPSQRAAIEAPPVSAFFPPPPCAGKTFCLIERIRFLIEQLGVEPARICAFTFTNKAADEIASRLARQLGPRAEGVKRRTIHAFCAELLREYASHVELTPGFGIADEAYQVTVLRRLGVPRKWLRSTLTRFSTHRLRHDPLYPNDAAVFAQYERFLAERNIVDFDTLVVKAARLLEHTDAGDQLRARWTALLVDEFQDLNPVQYRIMHALAREHRHIFAVGDDEQSIYAWAGADPSVFTSFVNDFGITKKLYLQENRRCPREVFDLARRLISINTPLFGDRTPALTERASSFDVAAVAFESDDAEVAWIVDDIRRDRDTNGHGWGDVALLYRKHDTGDGLEAALINAGIACRLAQGRSLSEEPVVAYVLAALRVIAYPADEIHREGFFAVSLPTTLLDEARARAQSTRHDLLRQLNRMAEQLPRADVGGRHIRRALYRYRNLAAIGRVHATLDSLVRELLSQSVGKPRSVLEERHDELTDPADNPDVVALAARLRSAREQDRAVSIPRMGGVEIALKGMLVALGFGVRLGDDTDAERIAPNDTPSLGIALGVFKALQLLEIGERPSAYRDFTAIDIETTGDDAEHAEVVEIAAVRVRDGQLVETFNTLVKPRGPISAGATSVHGIRDAEVVAAPRFEDIWPKFAAFCGDDIVMAHNGYEFDFRILKRMVRTVGWRFDLCTYDTLPLARELFPTSRKLADLARFFSIDTGRSHRALDDARTLARVFVELDAVKLVQARKTALANLLDHLGVALALSDEVSLCAEARLLRGLCCPFALARHSTCLESYERERGENESLPGVDDVIEALGGTKLMVKIRSEKNADERYPAAMLRLRRLLAHVGDGSLESQISSFLERVLLSARTDGVDPDRDRVNLLTLHSTKGLEFSRVYVVGVEDAQLPGHAPNKEPTPKETEEARRLLYVGMTRAKDRLVLSRAANRRGTPTGGHRFLDEMGLKPVSPVPSGCLETGVAERIRR